MAVAVKNTPAPVAARPASRLALVSLVGVVFVLGSIGIVFYVLPALWHAGVAPAGSALASMSFVNYALLGAVMLAGAVGLGWVGTQLAGSDLPHGWKAGVAVGIAGIVLWTLVMAMVGAILVALLPEQTALGLPLTAAIGAVLMFLFVRAFFRPAFEKKLVTLEDQGWFTMAPYKKTQGQRVRRGTLIALLAIAGTGIWTLHEHKTLETASQHWELTVPFTTTTLTLLRDVRFTGPILLIFGALWFSYRLVNFPTFADFLIATEAELNKVSWATRKRLVQDTIVVLTTVVLVTAFIFFVDIFWFRALRAVGVLNLPTAAEQESKQGANW